MLRCIVVDDEAGAIEILSRYISRLSELELLNTFSDPVEAFRYLDTNEVDLVFLDINMPNLSGIQFSNLIRDRNIPVIFCTAYPEYAVESYEHEAVDYLLKPIPFERFLKAVNKVLKTYKTADKDEVKKSHEDKLFIKSGSKIHQLDLTALLYAEKDGHYIIFHTDSGEILSRMTMRDLAELLPGTKFVRVHRSYVVSIDRIDTIQKHSVYIRKNEIPIGENYKEEFFGLIEHSGQ
ncbi:MAG: response regulator transcription factor [bacterium]|nr:response regulator transcription factor [bacterium]